MHGEWRYFGTRQVAQARAWAAGGGIAVHENLYKSRGRRAAHLLARDEASLITAARSLGCDERWIQRTSTVHSGENLRQPCRFGPRQFVPGLGRFAMPRALAPDLFNRLYQGSHCQAFCRF